MVMSGLVRGSRNLRGVVVTGFFVRVSRFARVVVIVGLRRDGIRANERGGDSLAEFRRTDARDHDPGDRNDRDEPCAARTGD